MLLTILGVWLWNIPHIFGFQIGKLFNFGNIDRIILGYLKKEDLLTQLDDVLGYKSTFLHLVLTILSYISYIHMSKFIYITRWGLDKYKLIYTYFKHECMKTLCLVFIPAAEHKLTQITWKKNVINKIYIHARRLTNIKIYFFSTIIQLFLYIPPKCFSTLPAPGISFLLIPHKRSICNDNIT